jgi:hypothetical protein
MQFLEVANAWSAKAGLNKVVAEIKANKVRFMVSP